MSVINSLVFVVEGKSFKVDPTTITPSVEVIKNTERTLNGTLCCDIVSEKESLEIVWDMLGDADFVVVKGTFSSISKSLKVGYALSDSGEMQEIMKNLKSYYCDSFSYVPYYIGNQLFWQSVSVKLVQV